MVKYVLLLVCSVFGMNNDALLVERPPTGSRRRRDVTLPLDQQSVSLFESSESTVLLPSRERSTPTKPHPSSAMPTMHKDTLQPAVKHNETLSTVSASLPTSAGVRSAISPDTALQQQLSQQQLLIQQQSLQLQQLSNKLATSKMQLEQARYEGEKSTKEKLDLVKNQVKGLQEELQEEKSTSSKLKVCSYLCGYPM